MAAVEGLRALRGSLAFTNAEQEGLQMLVRRLSHGYKEVPPLSLADGGLPPALDIERLEEAACAAEMEADVDLGLPEEPEAALPTPARLPSVTDPEWRIASRDGLAVADRFSAQHAGHAAAVLPMSHSSLHGVALGQRGAFKDRVRMPAPFPPESMSRTVKAAVALGCWLEPVLLHFTRALLARLVCGELLRVHVVAIDAPLRAGCLSVMPDGAVVVEGVASGARLLLGVVEAKSTTREDEVPWWRQLASEVWIADVPFGFLAVARRQPVPRDADPATAAHTAGFQLTAYTARALSQLAHVNIKSDRALLLREHTREALAWPRELLPETEALFRRMATLQPRRALRLAGAWPDAALRRGLAAVEVTLAQRDGRRKRARPAPRPTQLGFNAAAATLQVTAAPALAARARAMAGNAAACAYSDTVLRTLRIACDEEVRATARAVACLEEGVPCGVKHVTRALAALRVALQPLHENKHGAIMHAAEKNTQQAVRRLLATLVAALGDAAADWDGESVASLPEGAVYAWARVSGLLTALRCVWKGQRPQLLRLLRGPQLPVPATLLREFVPLNDALSVLRYSANGTLLHAAPGAPNAAGVCITEQLAVEDALAREE